MTPSPLVNRRQFLAGAGLATAALTTSLVLPSSASASLRSSAADNWKRALADGYFVEGAAFDVRPLQDGLEVWEAHGGGYLIVESSSRTVLEGSATAPSPYRRSVGDLAYLGPAAYFALDRSRAVDLLSGEASNVGELRAIARDASDVFHDSLVVSPLDAALVSSSLGAGALNSTSSLTPVKPGEVKRRVLSYTLMTGRHVYPNTAGTCGWVAGSILTRYWHARSSAKTLLPTRYRSGTNLNPNPNNNFAKYIQGTGFNGTLGPDVRKRLDWNAKNQKVKYSSSWALGNNGVFDELLSNRPVITFGVMPLQNKKTGGHAVVAYGETNSGHLITHYGWSGYTNIVLNRGIAGGNVRFYLT